jgi:hypothetical protein
VLSEAHPPKFLAGYDGGLLRTGPTSTDCGFKHPDEASFTGAKLSGCVTLTRSNSVHGSAFVVTSFQ